MEAVIFDMDGVILDTERAYKACIHALADKYNLTNIDDVIHKCMGTTEEYTKNLFLETYGHDFTYDQYYSDLYTMFDERYGNGQIPVKKGVFEILSFLKENGYKIALASSTKTETVHQQMEDAHLASYFDVIIGGDQIENSKPAPDIYLAACKQLDVQPEQAYAIEDSFNGVRSGTLAHCKTIMVPDLIAPDEEMKSIAYCICDDLLEALNIIKESY